MTSAKKSPIWTPSPYSQPSYLDLTAPFCASLISLNTHPLEMIIQDFPLTLGSLYLCNIFFPCQCTVFVNAYNTYNSQKYNKTNKRANRWYPSRILWNAIVPPVSPLRSYKLTRSKKNFTYEKKRFHFCICGRPQNHHASAFICKIAQNFAIALPLFVVVIIKWPLISPNLEEKCVRLPSADI